MAVWVAAAVIAALVLLQAAVYRARWDAHLTLSVAPSARAVFEGESVRIDKELRNAKLLPLPFIMLYFSAYGFEAGHGAAARCHVSAFGLASFRSARISHTYLCARRGYYRLRDFNVDCCNLMMSDWQTRRFHTDHTLVVYPKIIDAACVDVPYQRLLGEMTAKRFLLDDPFAFRGIREYQPYDSMRSINFKASARTGTLMSNRYDSSYTRQLLIVLNLQDHTTVSVSRISENAIRLAAFLARYSLGEGVSVSLLSNGVDTTTGAHTHLCSGDLNETHVYEALARIDLLKRPQPMRALLDDFPVPAGCSVALISRYQGHDLRDWFEAVRQDPIRAMWVVPVLRGESSAARGDGIYVWEADCE